MCHRLKWQGHVNIWLLEDRKVQILQVTINYCGLDPTALPS